MERDPLGDVLVVTVRKSFWASPEAARFPRRLYARVFYGHSTRLANSLVVFARALVAVAVLRPHVVLLGSVERTVPWFIRARRLGLLGRARLVVTNQLQLDDAQLEHVDRDVVYSQTWIDAQRPAVRRRAVFAPLPADGDFEAARRGAGPGGFVFSGGGAGRDFASLIRAVEGTDLELEIVTFSRDTLGWDRPLPANVRVSWLLPLADFLARAASASVVAVPLRDPASDHGQTTVVQALALGKAVVATRSPGVVDYVEDGREGLLVDAGDVEGYRSALVRLTADGELRRTCERRAAERARELTYAAFAQRLERICRDVLSEYPASP